MINSMMNKKRGHRLSKLIDDGDHWAPNNLLTPISFKSIERNNDKGNGPYRGFGYLTNLCIDKLESVI